MSVLTSARGRPELDIAWDGADMERSVAFKLLDKGATLAVVDRGGQRHEGVKNIDSLPPGRVTVKEANLTTGASFDDEDLKQFAMLSEIEAIALQGRHREADPVNCDRALTDDVRCEVRRKTERQPFKVRLRAAPLQHSNGIDVTLDEMTAKPAVGTKRTLEVHARPRRQPAKRRHADRLGADIGPNSAGISAYDCQADTVDGEAVSGLQLRS